RPLTPPDRPAGRAYTRAEAGMPPGPPSRPARETLEDRADPPGWSRSLATGTATPPHEGPTGSRRPRPSGPGRAGPGRPGAGRPAAGPRGPPAVGRSPSAPGPLVLERSDSGPCQGESMRIPVELIAPLTALALL